MTETKKRYAVEDYSVDLFRGYLGTRFVFRLPEQAIPICGETLTLSLVRVDQDERLTRHYAKHAERTKRPLRAPFSLLFRGESENRLSSGLLTIEHEDFEPFAMFVSRVQTMPSLEDEEMNYDLPHYEAVFG